MPAKKPANSKSVAAKKAKPAAKKAAPKITQSKPKAPATAKGQTWLITGGTGFLGCHLAEYLLSQGIRVKLLDRQPLTEPSLWGRVENYQGDIRNELLLRRVMEGCDVVVHAAMALPLEKPKEIIDTGIRGTRIVLKAAHELKIPRVVHISSTAVYGIPDHHPLAETDKLEGVGPYGTAKVEAESVVAEFRKKGMAIAVLRPKTFIGTGRLGVFQILFDWVREGRRIPVLGDGGNRYQLLAVSDLVQAIWLAATRPAAVANDTFNVGAAKYGTVQQDFAEFFQFARTGSRLFPVPAAPSKAALAALESVNLSPLYKWVYGTMDKDSFVSTEKIQKQLGWQPEKSNADALKETYAWYRQHWQEYQHLTGTTHKVAWKQGALRIIRWFS